jgi:uncharacterized damage-inducible protein DinB
MTENAGQAGSVLSHFYRHNLWANLKMIDLCAGLPEAALDAEAPGVFGSARATLLHMLANEENYVTSLTGQAPEPTLFELRRQGFPGWEVLRERARLSGQALIELAESRPDGRVLRGEFEGQPYQMPIAVVMVQAIDHAVEHRTHICSALSANGVEAPRFDSWTFDEEQA